MSNSYQAGMVVTSLEKPRTFRVGDSAAKPFLSRGTDANALSFQALLAALTQGSVVDLGLSQEGVSLASAVTASNNLAQTLCPAEGISFLGQLVGKAPFSAERLFPGSSKTGLTVERWGSVATLDGVLSNSLETTGTAQKEGTKEGVGTEAAGLETGASGASLKEILFQSLLSEGVSLKDAEKILEELNVADLKSLSDPKTLSGDKSLLELQDARNSSIETTVKKAGGGFLRGEIAQNQMADGPQETGHEQLREPMGDVLEKVVSSKEYSSNVQKTTEIQKSSDEARLLRLGQSQSAKEEGKDLLSEDQKAFSDIMLQHGGFPKGVLDTGISEFKGRELPSIKDPEGLARFLSERASENSQKIIQLKLDPPNLGKLTAILSSKGDQVTVRFVAQDLLGAKVLENSWKDLSHALSERGLLLSGFLVDHGQSHSGGKEAFQAKKEGAHFLPKRGVSLVLKETTSILADSYGKSGKGGFDYLV